MKKQADTQPVRALPPLDADHTVMIDIDRLIVTKLLIAANSGGGKSFAIRRIAEVTHGLVQQIIFDFEGEFHTLREKFDYVLIGPGGDAPCTLQSAALLAIRLLELGASAIIDLSDLGVSRSRYVRLFVESMMNAPRDLWHPVFVVLDEAHKFCPENGAGESESTHAVKDLATRGRKRGFCLIAATQRIAEFHKTVAAEFQNMMIGRTGLGLDIDRARRALGMDRKTADALLPKLPDGNFYVFGSALSAHVRQVMVGPVVTTHPTAGQRQLPTTPPRSRVRQMLAQLADLPAEAEAEATTVKQLQARVRELEGLRAPSATFEGMTVTQATYDALQQVNAELRNALAEARDWEKVQGDALEAASAELDLIANHAIEARNVITNKLEDGARPVPTPIVLPVRQNSAVQVRITTADSSLSRMGRAFLTALAQHPVGLTKRKVLIHARYRRSGDTDKMFAKLMTERWATLDGDLLVLTPAGGRVLGDYIPLPVGDDLRRHVLGENGKLSKPERAILASLCDVYPESLAKHEALERSGYKRSGDTDKAFAHLVDLGYATASERRRDLKAAAELFS